MDQDTDTTEECCELCGGPAGECSTCEHCNECVESYCGCCDNCGEPNGYCTCCGSCGSAYCGECSECGNYGCECECCSDCGDYPCSCEQGFGRSSVAPWVARKERPKFSAVDGQHWSQVWGIDRSIDVAQSCADYYLLEALVGGIVNGSDAARTDRFCEVLRQEAADLLSALVERLDRSFRAYVDMAVGGELRYHRCFDGHNRQDRSAAWVEWKAIRTAAGSQALIDASDLFIEFESDTSSYGGTRWAQAAMILHARETGRISPHIFIDRVFNAQHNGGALLNKVDWAVSNRRSMNLWRMQDELLPAHGSDDMDYMYRTLLSVASEGVRNLVLDAWEAGNWAKRTVALPTVRKPDWSKIERKERAARRVNDLALDASKVAAAASLLVAAGVMPATKVDAYGYSCKSYYSDLDQHGTGICWPNYWDKALEVPSAWLNVTAEQVYEMGHYGNQAPWTLPPVPMGTVPAKGYLVPHKVKSPGCDCCQTVCSTCGYEISEHIMGEYSSTGELVALLAPAAAA